MKNLPAVRKWLEKMLERVVIAIMVVLVLVVLWQVVSRYALGAASSWSEELAKILLIWGSLLGAALAYSEKSHLGVDCFVNKLPVRPRSVVAMVIHLLVGSTAGYLLVYGGCAVAHNAFVYHQTTAALRLCWGYVYLVLPLTGLFFILFAAEFVREAFRVIITGDTFREDHNG